jgi:Gluconate 2-dehydrogenase subunit 3
MTTHGVNRRDALRRIALGSVGAAAVPGWVESLTALAVDHAHAAVQTATKAAFKPKVLTARQNETVIALSELIIPQTDTAGAKAARVNEFIDSVLVSAKDSDRQKFLAGLSWIDERARKEFGTDFVTTAPAQQISLLTTLSKPDARTPDSQTEADREGVEFFTAIKSMTITGYYTSEIGARQELGDDGTMFFAEFKGCTHPEHQG